MRKHMIEYKEKLIKAIKYHYPKAKIYLFGSWATGKQRASSDIDLAVDAGEEMDFYEYDRLTKTIENLDIPYKIDVIDMHVISKELKDRILKEGILWSE